MRQNKNAAYVNRQNAILYVILKNCSDGYIEVTSTQLWHSIRTPPPQEPKQHVCNCTVYWAGLRG